MSAQNNYWKDCIAEAAEECGLKLTSEQLDCLAIAVESGHENYGMSFYSPPSSDRTAAIEREWTAKIKQQRHEHEQYMRNAETAVRIALGLRHDDLVTIGEHGEVLRHGGRTERVQ